MEKHIYDEKNGLHYTLGEDGLYYPDITIDEQEHHLIGKYGRMREHFLKEHRAGTYTRLLLTGKLNSHLFEIDTLVHQRVDENVVTMAKAEGTDEDLKASNQMEWVGRMNNYKACAEEIMLKEIIYA